MILATVRYICHVRWNSFSVACGTVGKYFDFGKPYLSVV